MNMNINLNDSQLLEIFKALPVAADKFARYLLKYMPIIRILNDYCEGYAFVDQIYDVLKRTGQKVAKSTLNDIINKGEEDCFWGVFKVNKFRVIYLKKNSYLCYLRKNRSSLEQDKITTKMIVRSALLLNLKAQNVERIDIPGIENLYRIETVAKGQIFYVLLVTSSTYSTHLKRCALTTELVRYAKKKGEYGAVKGFKILSSVSLDKAIEEDFITQFNSTSFKFGTITADITKYFNGLSVSIH